MQLSKENVLKRVMGWGCSREQAITWYQTEPIPAFGGQTAEMIVNAGKVEAVEKYLESVEYGGFA